MVTPVGGARTASASIPRQGPALANLHTHLGGSVRPRTWFELTRRASTGGLTGADGPAGPRDEADARRRLCMLDNGSERSLTALLRTIAQVYPALQTPQALERVAYEAAVDNHLGGVSYVEVRFAPELHARAGGVGGAVRAVATGLHRAEAEVGIRARAIVCLMRGSEPERAREVTDAAIGCSDLGVVGLDVAGDEGAFPSLLPYAAILRRARDAGLGLTVHAGETGDTEPIREAVCDLGVRRIGHGVSVLSDPKLLRELAAREVTVEACPTSNLCTGAVTAIDRHPLWRLMEAGVPVAIGDDDPVTVGTTLAGEFAALAGAGLTAHEAGSLRRAALRAGFDATSATGTRTEASGRPA
ncbi:MAG: adenosine deaminase [Frankia sp.]